MKIKSLVLAMMMVMSVAASVSAATPLGYDEGVNYDLNIKDWRQQNYEWILPQSGAAINVEWANLEEGRKGVKMD